MEKYDIYLLDFDGTVVDSARSLFLVYKEAFGKSGIEVTLEEAKLFMKETVDISYRKKGGDPNKYQEFYDTVNSFIHDDSVTKANEFFKGSREAILELSRLNKRLGFVTSNSSEHVKQVLKYLNFDPSLFEVFVGHDEVSRFKPDPQGILIALNALKVDLSKDKVCYVGDSPSDMKAANAANIDSIFVRRENNKDDIHEGKYEISSLEDLIF